MSESGSEKQPKPCILHYSNGSKTAGELFRVVAASHMDDDELTVRLCYTCKKWWVLDKDFLEHITSHGEEMPSVGLGAWTNPDDKEIQEYQTREHFRKTCGLV